jgi:hypothetical protein
MARILATLAAALVAAFTFTHSQSLAEPLNGPQTAVGQPLNIVPLVRHARLADHSIGTRTPHRVVHPIAHRRAAPAPTRVPAPSPAAETRVVAAPVVVRGQDTSGLIGMLPWWRADPMETIHYLDGEAHSGVLAAADAWLGMPIAESHMAAIGIAVPRTSTDEVSELEFDAEANVVDAGELNAIDLLSVAVAGRRAPDQPWMQAWLAMLAGALAAAATARYLFA